MTKLCLTVLSTVWWVLANQNPHGFGSPTAALLPIYSWKLSITLLLIFYPTEGAADFDQKEFQPAWIYYPIDPDDFDLDFESFIKHFGAFFCKNTQCKSEKAIFFQKGTVK